MAQPISEQRLRLIVNAVRAEAGRGAAPTGPQPPRPFVTISRAGGAGAIGLSHRLAERLNQTASADPPWTTWDRELVEKVVAEHRIPNELIESVEDSRESWFGEFLRGLCSDPETSASDEFRTYRRVALTIRGLALLGHTIIVGRGGVFITGKLAGGVHVRLVAPLEHRVAHVVELLKAPAQRAAAEVRRIDRARDAFYRRYWPGKPLSPETFSVTLNTAMFTVDAMAACLLPLVSSMERAGPERTP